MWDELLTDILRDEGSAAKAMLAAGHPIYYVEHDTPDGLYIKEYPDGRLELISASGLLSSVK